MALRLNQIHSAWKSQSIEQPQVIKLRGRRREQRGIKQHKVLYQPVLILAYDSDAPVGFLLCRRQNAVAAHAGLQYG